ncbi:hypothetical protein D3C87_355480 [compost metagenome]|nr:hypothetical protein [Stenotrophomonas sp.]HCV95661.1 hypothetical protein [Stenotrophomonas sp.]
MHADSHPGAAAAPAVKANVQRAPWLGLVSFAALPVGAAMGYAAQWANHGVTAGASTTGVSIGVLASAVVGLLAALGSRVRQERWAWLGIVGTLLGAVPLAVFIVSMLLHR